MESNVRSMLVHFQNMPNMDDWDEPMNLSSTQLNTHTHMHTHIHTFLVQNSTSGELTIWLEKQVFHPQFEMLDELHLLLNKKISCIKGNIQ